MMRRTIPLLILALAATAVIGAGKSHHHRLEDKWRNPLVERQEFAKIVVIGISDDDEARRRFEDKFLSHLRGRGVDGVTSYSLVPDLQAMENRNELLEKIAELGIDGAISIRLVALGERDEVDWAVDFGNWLGQETTLRKLVDDTLPVEQVKSKRYGVEVAMWGTPNRVRMWAARSSAEKRKEFEAHAGDWVQVVMDALKDAGLI